MTRRKPMASDFGTYLKFLRLSKNPPISRKTLAEGLSLSPSTVRLIEDGYNPPPNLQRLKLWLTLIGESKRFTEASAFLAAIKTYRKINYKPRHPANEHIDRLIDAYENGNLDEADLTLLQMVAPKAYS